MVKRLEILKLVYSRYYLVNLYMLPHQYIVAIVGFLSLFIYSAGNSPFVYSVALILITSWFPRVLNTNIPPKF